MKPLLFSLLVIYSTLSFAQVEDKNNEPKNEESKSLREKYKFTTSINYSLIDLWILSKYGVSASYNINQDKTFEIEYLRGSISLPVIVEDLGSITEQRISLLLRNFSGRNSFHFFYGINYYNFKARLGNAYLDTISSNAPGVDLIKVKTLGLNWGFGNRWQYDQVSFGVDWLALDIPIVKLEQEEGFTSLSNNESNKEDVRSVLDLIRKIPRFAAFRVNVGMSF